MKNLLIKLIIRLYISTFRYTITFNEKVDQLSREKKKLVFFTWHNQVAILLGQKSQYKYVTMVSKSKDGDILAPAMESFGHAVVRASSSKGASAGLINILDYMEKGYHGAMAVDGPKGPKYKAKPGVLYMAKKADKILVPIVCNCQNFYRLNTWDNLVLPKPFAKVSLRVLDPIEISDSFEKSVIKEELNTVQNKIMEETRVYSKDII